MTKSRRGVPIPVVNLHHYGKCGLELFVQKQPLFERAGPGIKPQEKLISAFQITRSEEGCGPINFLAHHVEMQAILLSQTPCNTRSIL
jgi:ribosomal protein S27AE